MCPLLKKQTIWDVSEYVNKTSKITNKSYFYINSSKLVFDAREWKMATILTVQMLIKLNKIIKGKLVLNKHSYL